MEPPATFAVGVMVMDATAFTTVAVYEYVLEAKAGANVPELSTKVANFASVFTDAALVTAIVYDVAGDVPS
jgi:hypothetical protein